MTESTLFEPEPEHEPEHAAAEVLAKPGQRLAFTGGGQHWHGTLTRTSTRPDGTPRLHVDVDADNTYGINSVAYRLGSHFRPTREGEPCPDCGTPDRGEPLYSRP